MEILYVDDDFDDITLFLEALQKIDRSIQFCYALNANDALKKLNNYLWKPDAIFVDYQVGEIDRYECVRNIKERPELKDIPVVILSTNITISMVDEFNRIGVYNFLSKTALLSDLEPALKVFMESISQAREKNQA